MSFYSIKAMKIAKSMIEMCSFHILSRFYFSQELCWRLTTRMIAVFIIMYSITNMVFSLPNLFQLCSEWRHHSCQMAIMSALCSFTSELSTASILLTPLTKQQKKNQNKTRQKETKEGMWDHRAGKTNQGKEDRQELSKPAQVHYHFMWAGPWDTEQPPGLQRKELPPSLSFPFTLWDTSKAGSAPRAPRSWSRSWMTIWHWPLAVLELPSSLLCQQVLFSHHCWIFNSAHFFPTLASSCIGLWGMLTNMTDRLLVYTESKLDSKITLNSSPRQTPTTPGMTASPWRTTEQDFLI